MSSHKELREAFIDGSLEGRNFSRHPYGDALRIATERAAVLYPAPKVKVVRPREVELTDMELRYRVVNGAVEVKQPLGWQLSQNFGSEMSIAQMRRGGATYRDIAAVIELIANPTETVEVEA